MRNVVINRMRNTVAAVIAAVLVIASCSKELIPGGSGSGGGFNRVVTPRTPDVLLLYSAGFNTLSTELEDDVRDLESGWLPLAGSASDVVLVYSRRVSSSRSFTDKTPSYLIRLASDGWGNVVRDTLVTYPADTVAASVYTLNTVLSTVRDMFPGSRYGMIFSSHASGWVPPGYYSTGKINDFSVPLDYEAMSVDGRRRLMAMPVPYILPDEDIPGPAVKSIGVDNITSTSTYEMELEAFAEAVPMKLDYIIFDACLMGGVEVAYALKDKCHYVVFSQTEVLADGLCDYKTLTSRLLNKNIPALVELCEDSREHYASQQDEVRKSLTISLVDCSRMDALASACRTMFQKYRSGLLTVWPDDVQGYFRYRKHWFYDLRDILVKANASEEDLAVLDSALDDCVLYKASSSYFISLEIKTSCGLSMYLPADGSTELNSYYRTLSWNKATGLVQ